MDLNIKIKRCDISRVYSNTFLWVHIDSKLNWKQHINYINTKLSKCKRTLIKAGVYLPKSSLEHIEGNYLKTNMVLTVSQIEIYAVGLHYKNELSCILRICFVWIEQYMIIMEINRTACIIVDIWYGILRRTRSNTKGELFGTKSCHTVIISH